MSPKSHSKLTNILFNDLILNCNNTMTISFNFYLKIKKLVTSYIYILRLAHCNLFHGNQFFSTLYNITLSTGGTNQIAGN